MKKLVQFGERGEGYAMPVLNEREIRAAAGILFLATFISLVCILFRENFVPIKYVISFFLADFLVRVFVNPRFSPSLVMGRLLTGNQQPEYVSAGPKKFAWTIGVILSAIMFVLLVVFNSYSVITTIICYTCLSFLFFESAFGICLGCKFYPLFFKEKPQLCPGEICNPHSKKPIQQTSRLQWLILCVFILLFVLMGWVFRGAFSRPPHDLFASGVWRVTSNKCVRSTLVAHSASFYSTRHQ